MEIQTAHIFPAFVIKYLGIETSLVTQHQIFIQERFNRIRDICKIDLTEFDIDRNNFLDNELKTQLITYTISCCISDILKLQNRVAKYVSGFSMGIYAAYYHLNVFDFESGAKLITDIFRTISKQLNKSYCMISVIGFKYLDIKQMLQSFSFEIVIQNGEHSFVLAGEKQECNKLLNLLIAEGAIYTNVFNVDVPYHSTFIQHTRESIEFLTDQLTFLNAKIPYVSMIDQRQIHLSSDMSAEVVNNLFTPLNFLKTVQFLDNKGINQCIESGPGNSLTKSAKFIESALRFNTCKILN